ncbi:reverse transcriptase family protein, partial [Streptomyces sundarbansensis]
GKKDIHGQYTKKRAVIDPRLLNSIVKNVDRMPLPLISDLHQRMGSSTIFTTFDIKQCFHRFLIKESDRPKTAFTVPRTGMQYQFRHCPFGLTSTGNIVQRVLTNLFADLPYTALYIDDLQWVD